MCIKFVQFFIKRSFIQIFYSSVLESFYSQEKLFVSLTLPELPHGSQNPQLQQQQSVDMETLAHYIMASPQFQQLLITETQDKGQIESDVHQRKDFYHMSSEVHLQLSLIPVLLINSSSQTSSVSCFHRLTHTTQTYSTCTIPVV